MIWDGDTKERSGHPRSPRGRCWGGQSCEQRHPLRDRQEQAAPALPCQDTGIPPGSAQGGSEELEGGPHTALRGAGAEHPAKSLALSPQRPPGLKLPRFVTVCRKKKRFRLAGTSCSPAPYPLQRGGGGGGGDLPPHLLPLPPLPREAAALIPIDRGPCSRSNPAPCPPASHLCQALGEPARRPLIYSTLLEHALCS